jgi:hypothetical protein
METERALVALQELLDLRRRAVAEAEPLEPLGRRRPRHRVRQPVQTPKYSSGSRVRIFGYSPRSSGM